jgi:hypothetical protein
MTLNIVVLTPEVVYLSADFRLTAEGSLVTDRSSKTVHVDYETWAGLITYTGLGRWKGTDVSDWIATWLTGQSDLTMEQVARLLERQGTGMLTELSTTEGKIRRHTFTLVGFNNGVATAYLISNFEDGRKARKVPDGSLSRYTKRLEGRERAWVLVTGQAGAVTDGERKALERQAGKHGLDAEKLRRRLAVANKRAAQSSKSHDSVSEDCVVLSLRNSLNATIDVSGAGPGVSHHLSSGLNYQSLIDEVWKGLGVDRSKINVVGGVSTRFGPNNPPELFSRCSLDFFAPDADVGYIVEELDLGDFLTVSPQSISANGFIVGTANSPNSFPIPWLLDGMEVKSLGYSGGAAGVNLSCQVAGTFQGDNGKENAILWEEGSVTDLGIYKGEVGLFEGSDSSARSINISGLVAGTVRSKQEERGRPNTRPAVFRRGMGVEVAMDVPAQFGSESTDINDEGLVLVCSLIEIFNPRSILWNWENGGWAYVGGDKDAGVHPIALNNEGTVIGQAKDAKGRLLAVICERGSSWRELGTPPGWAPTCINDRGVVAGYAVVDGLWRPWIRFASGRTRWLPYARDHKCVPTKINDLGYLVGSAGADHGGHALRWVPA